MAFTQNFYSPLLGNKVAEKPISFQAPFGVGNSRSRTQMSLQTFAATGDQSLTPVIGDVMRIMALKSGTFLLELYTMQLLIPAAWTFDVGFYEVDQAVDELRLPFVGAADCLASGLDMAGGVDGERYNIFTTADIYLDNADTSSGVGAYGPLAPGLRLWELANLTTADSFADDPRQTWHIGFEFTGATPGVSVAASKINVHANFTSGD